MPISLKGLWHASAHVRQLDFRSDEQFFKIGVLVKKSSSIDPETPEKAMISVFKSYLVQLGSFKRHIYFVFLCKYSRKKFEVIEENCTTHAHYRDTVPLMKRQRGLRRVPLPAHIQVDASLPRQFHHQVSFLRTKFSAFVLIVHEYSFNHLACEQAHFCKFGENFGCRRGKVTKKKAGLTQNCYRALLIIRYRIRTFKSGKRKLLGRSNLFEGLRCFIPALEVRSRKTWMK